MMSTLGTKQTGEKMTELETARLCLETIPQELGRLNLTKGLHMEIEMLLGIAKDTDNRKAKNIMKDILEVYQQLILDVDTVYLKAQHMLQMRLLEEQAKQR